MCNDSPTTSFEIIVNFLIYLIADIFFFLCQFYQKLIIFSSFKINEISSLNALLLLLFIEIDKTWILETVMFWLSWSSFLLSKSALISMSSWKDKQIFRYTGWLTKMSLFSLAIIFTKIRKPSRFFLHRYWKFIEFFWWKLL